MNRIQTNIVYAHSDDPMNIGKEYNRVMDKSDSDYVVFLDHDAAFTDKYWFDHISSIIEENPDVACFTAVTNRIGNKQQLALHREPILGAFNWNSHDMMYHRGVGEAFKNKYGNEIEDLDYYQKDDEWRALSGVLMVVKKTAWEDVKFNDGFLGVDGQFHKDLLDNGHRCCLMLGVYVYHFYRGDQKIDHLEKANKNYKPILIKND